MLKRKPETLALFVALIGTLTVLFVFLADLVVARHRDFDAGERRLQHFGIMMAEHTARSFEAIDVLLREMATDLSHNRRNWENWEASQGWEYVAQRHSRAMPQLRDLIIFDRDGNQRFISSYFPTPRINVRDRPYFATLTEGAEATTYGPYIGRNSGRYSYAIARRITGDGDVMSGIAFAAIEPAYLQDFCWSNRLSDDFEAVLINAKGQIVASCRPSDLSAQSPILGSLAGDTLFAGQLRGLLPDTGLANGNGMLISVSPVPGFTDLRILTAIPESTLLANWRSRLIELSTLALLVTTVLFVGGLLVRRQVREMAALTAELAAGHEHLGARIRTATLELAGQKDTAERANRAKSRFLAAASHDLRQPLHALSLFAADLQRQIRNGTSSSLPRLAEQISTSTAMLSELLDSLLDISRLDVVGIKPEIRLFPLGPLFERLANSGRRAALDHNLTLRFRPSKLWVESDPMMIERIIANLVSNALRYTPAGGRVLVTARQRGEEVLIEVRDSGMGIAPEHQAAIFAEFYQIGNEAREHNKGLGLGLSIVDRLARALNVSISLNSRLGEGTTFALRVRGGRPLHGQPTELLPAPLGKVHCIGHSEAIADCLRLAESWNYAVSHDDGAGREAPPRNAVIICEMALAEAVSQELANDTPFVVLSSGEHPNIPSGAHALPLPVRPARLRALLGQLQKTLSKSTP
ncbi:MAG: ATP-binding region, ATPase-like:Histidine kinase N-terminal [Proteobacteria bacterium]|nr:ATP-binding region, ATPase-like:Histidine kinase N-terminal [Pseudomonadota bacterium]